MEPPPETVRPTELRLDVSEPAAGDVRVAVHGDIDMTTSDDFRATLMRLVAAPAVTRVVLDATHLGFIDSNGVTVLVKAHRAAGERGIGFAVAHTRDPIRGLLEMLGVYDMLTGIPAG